MFAPMSATGPTPFSPCADHFRSSPISRHLHRPTACLKPAHNWAHAPQQSAAIDHLVGWIATRAAPLCTTNSRAEPPRSPAGEPYAGAGASTGARHSNELPALTVASTCRRDAENERSHHALRLLTSCLSRDKLSLPLESKIRLRPWCPLPGRFRLWCKK